MQKTKDLLDIIRQALIVFLFLTLLFFPSKINSILVEAGFTKGSLLGFDWQKQIKASRDSLEIARAQVDSVHSQLTAIAPKLESLQASTTSDTAKARIKALNDSLHASIRNVNLTNMMLNRNLALHNRLLQDAP